MTQGLEPTVVRTMPFSVQHQCRCIPAIVIAVRAPLPYVPQETNIISQAMLHKYNRLEPNIPE